jgi:LysM repeat protein
MDKLNELKALADLAQQLEDNGHYIEANTVHNKFIRLAQKQTDPIGPGESYTTIARQYGVSVDALKAANPPRKDQKDPSKLYPGDRLNLPAPVKPQPSKSILDTVTDFLTGKKDAPQKPVVPTQKKPVVPTQKKPVVPTQKKPVVPTTKPLMHEVLPGQSLSLIGKRYGIPWQKIQKDNGIEKSTDIFPGQKLVIKK